MSKFNPESKIKVIADAAEASVVVDTRVAEKTPTPFTLAPAERLANAKQRVRAYRTDPSSPMRSEGYCTEYAGPLTSEHEWDILHCLVGLTQCQPHYSMPMFGFDRKTAEGVALDEKSNIKFRVPIAKLRADVDARIAELGVAPHLLWEHMAENHTAAEDAGFYRLPFDERIVQFKAQVE